MALIEDLLKSATGLLTTGGGAGDMAGEAANFDNIGKQVQSGVFNVSDPTALNPNATSNRALNPSYNNLGVPENKNLGVAGVNQQQVQTNQSPVAEIAGNPSLFQKIFNMSPQDAQAKWKDKGGFDGLMSNPAFTLGLAMMQSGASGEKISQSIFNNALKSGAISTQYQEKVKSKRQAPIEATAENIENTKQLLKTMDIVGPNFFERVIGTVKGQNKEAMFEEAAETITIALEEEMANLQANNKSGKRLKFDTDFKKKIIKRLIKEGKISKKKGGIRFLTKGTTEVPSSNPFTEKRAEGGPVSADQNYIVGEKGPEMFVPETNGSILHNDDAKVVSMLLESNPQLKNVSRARAVKILKNRFPDYF